MKKIHPIAQIILFPLTAYLFIGTSFLFVLYKIDTLTYRIGKKTSSDYFKYSFKVQKYHKKNFWITFFFFLIVPFVFIYNLGHLIAVSIIYLFEYIVDVVEKIYKTIVEQVELIWEKISNYF